MANRGAGTFVPTVNRHDTGDPQRLYQYLQTLERSVRELTQQNADLADQLRTARSTEPAPLSANQLAQVQAALSATGRFPLPLTDLSGATASGQNPKFASGTTLPDPITSVYDSFVVTGGTYDTLWRLNRDVNPHAWVQIATFPAGSLMTLDTTQTVVSTGIKTIQAAWTYQVAPLIENALDANLVLIVRDTNAVGTAAAGIVRASGDTAFLSMIGHGTGRTLTRCGITLGAWTELLQSAGNGMLIDTNTAIPIVLGTNNVERMRLAGTGGAAGLVLTVGQLIQMVGAIAADTTQLEIKKSTADGGASVFKVDYEGDATLHDLSQSNGSVELDTVGTSVDVNGLDASTATSIFRILYAGSAVAAFDGTGRLGINGDMVIGDDLDVFDDAHVGGDTTLDGTLGVTGLSSLGTAKVGAGTTITKVVVYTPTLSPVAVAADTTAEQTFTVTGLTTSDTICSFNKPTAQAGLGVVGMRVSAADTLAITYSNNTAGSITPTASEVYRIVALRS